MIDAGAYENGNFPNISVTSDKSPGYIVSLKSNPTQSFRLLEHPLG